MSSKEVAAVDHAVLDALYTALPFVEDARLVGGDQQAMTAQARALRATIEAAEGADGAAAALNQRMADALAKAVPVLEQLQADPVYKPGVVARALEELRAVQVPSTSEKSSDVDEQETEGEAMR